MPAPLDEPRKNEPQETHRQDEPQEGLPLLDDTPETAPQELPTVLDGGPSCQVDLGGEGWAYRVVGEVEVGLDPEGVAVHRSTGQIYVACSRSNAL
ncbi:MAG: hypothetical protein ACYCU6_14715, partial [Acidimicrobiales bacterium]